MREYNHGKLVKETVLRVKDYDYHRKELKRDQRARKSEKRQAARVGGQLLGLCSLCLRVNCELLVLGISSYHQALQEMMAAPRSGETIYKGHRSYDLMRNLQIGILFSIAKTNREISEREVNPRLEDYKQQVRVNRPSRAVVHTSGQHTFHCNWMPGARFHWQCSCLVLVLCLIRSHNNFPAAASPLHSSGRITAHSSSIGCGRHLALITVTTSCP